MPDIPAGPSVPANGTTPVTIAGPPAVGHKMMVRAWLYNGSDISHGVNFVKLLADTVTERQVCYSAAVDSLGIYVAPIIVVLEEGETLFGVLDEANGAGDSPIFHANVLETY